MTAQTLRTAFSVIAVAVLVVAAVFVARTPASQHVTGEARHMLIHSHPVGFRTNR